MPTSTLQRALFLAVAVLEGACRIAGSPENTTACWKNEIIDPLAAPPTFPLDRELRVLNQGVTEWAEVPLSGAAAVALRVTVPPESTACVQLDTVKDGAGYPWVSASSSSVDCGEYGPGCSQRVSVADQTGFYVLPSTDPPPAPLAGDHLLVRAALRDCETLLPGDSGAPGAPSTLRLQALPIPLVPVDREGVIRLALIFTPGSAFFEGEDVGAPLEEALRLVNQAFRPARLRIEVARSRRLSAEHIDPLSFTPGDESELRHVLDLLRHCPDGTPTALASEVPVVLAGCLVANDPIMGQRRPLGRVTHIPGGLATTEGADGIFLTGRHCDPQGARLSWSATTLARLLAHELGHFLGLYHTVEADGTRDQLDDTHTDNAMYFDPLVASAQGFSPGQIQVMRRHPIIAFE